LERPPLCTLYLCVIQKLGTKVRYGAFPLGIGAGKNFG
jgi:hypothetical protein